jgi:ribonuclease PH
MRQDGRLDNQLRKVSIYPSYLKTAQGSAKITIGETQLICAASLESRIPSFLKGTGCGWLRAEYSMLPYATQNRTEREVYKGRLSGRTQEIQRMIGRVLRAVVDLKAIGERTIVIDCDVLQADGSTRAAAITGGCVAMAELFKNLMKKDYLKVFPMREFVAAISVGIVKGKQLLDLNYKEDLEAEVDVNIAMTSSLGLVEVQATAEKSLFSLNELIQLIELAKSGIKELVNIQMNSVGQSISSWI